MVRIIHFDFFQNHIHKLSGSGFIEEGKGGGGSEVVRKEVRETQFV